MALWKKIGIVIGVMALCIGSVSAVQEDEIVKYIQQLQNADSYIRKNAAEALGMLGDYQAIEPLIATLEDPIANVRVSAIEALGKLGDPQVIESLIATLNDPIAVVRASAIEALGKLGEPAIVPLTTAKDDKDAEENIRYGAAQALEKIRKSMEELSEWAKVQSENNIPTYEAFLQKYSSRGPLAEEVFQSVLEMVAALKQKGDVQQAEHILVKLWDIQEIEPEDVLTVGLTEDDRIMALSLSTGPPAQRFMRKVLSTTCEGRPSDSAALAISETPQSMMFRTDVSVSLPDMPDNLKAAAPRDLYYAVCLSRRIDDVHTCKYRPMGTIILKQIIWSLELRDVRTGEFVASTEIGGSIPSCPSVKKGGGAGHELGEAPSPENVWDWINKTLDMEQARNNLPKLR